MRTETRQRFNAYIEHMAEAWGTDAAAVQRGEKFAATPTVEQTIINRMQESSDFLRRVNMMSPTEQQGQKVGLGIGSTIASTTDTTANDRATQDPHTTDAEDYHCQQVNFDTHIRYATIDMWAKFADFETRIRDQILRRQSLDMITMGWNGTSRAANSDRATNPLLQDVAPGWLQKVRDNKASNRMNAVKVGDIGDDSEDYKNLDALVYDMVNSLLDPWYQDDTELVAITGRELMHDKLFPVVNEQSPNTPTETNAGQVILAQKRLGGLPTIRVPYFPSRGVAITRLDNLSIYVQENTRRRTVVDNAKRDQIENYESANIDYIVEDYGLMCFAEGILMPNAAGDAFA